MCKDFVLLSTIWLCWERSGTDASGTLASSKRLDCINQSINQSNQYSFIWWHDITTDINAIAIYIADLECSKAKYPAKYNKDVTTVPFIWFTGKILINIELSWMIML